MDRKATERILYRPFEYVEIESSPKEGRRVQHHIDLGGMRTATLELSSEGDSSLKYMNQDHLGSCVLMTDENGEVLQRAAFAPYGAPLDENGNVVWKDWANETEMYAGTAVQDETELLMTWRRPYDPIIGKFLASDPVMSENAFGYGNNNPLHFVDPMGFEATRISISSSYTPQSGGGFNFKWGPMGFPWGMPRLSWGSGAVMVLAAGPGGIPPVTRVWPVHPVHGPTQKPVELPDGWSAETSRNQTRAGTGGNKGDYVTISPEAERAVKKAQAGKSSTSTPDTKKTGTQTTPPPKVKANTPPPASRNLGNRLLDEWSKPHAPKEGSVWKRIQKERIVRDRRRTRRRRGKFGAITAAIGYILYRYFDIELPEDTAMMKPAGPNDSWMKQFNDLSSKPSIGPWP